MSSFEQIKKFRGSTKAKKLNRFFEQYVESIACCTQEYFTRSVRELEYPDYNLLQKERGMYSLMSSAIHRITPLHQSETSVIRRRDRRKRQYKNKEKYVTGSADLWLCLNEVEYYFEFKRSFCSIDNICNNGSGSLVEINQSWEKLLNQVKEIKEGIKKEAENDPYYEEYKSKTFFVGMHIISPRKKSKYKDKLLNYDSSDGPCRALQTLEQKLRRGPDAVLAWKLNDNDMRIRPIDWDNNDVECRWELNPFHLFLFNVERN